MSTSKMYAAFVGLIVGLFLLLEGSKLDPLLGIAINAIFIVVGAVLTLSYFYLIGDSLQRRLRAPPIVTSMPVLLVLGVMLVYQAVVRSIDVVSKGLFGVLGIILILVPAFVIYRAAKK